VIYEFPPFRLDTERLELTRAGAAVALEPQVFRLIQVLVEQRERVVSKDDLMDLVWDGRIVSDATLSTRINAARRALDDDGKAQAVIRTSPRRGFRFVAEVVTEGAATLAETPASPLAAGHAVSQEIRFCTANDGVRVAYATTGQGPPIVKSANWLNHLEFDWQSPVWRHVFTELSRDNTLVRYDGRGNGLSDRDVDDISFEAMVSDLETVIDAAGLDRVTLFGMSQGCSVSVAYAARHPERVERLILIGGYLTGWTLETPEEVERQNAIMALIRAGWGTDNAAFRQVFTSLLIPEGTTEQMQWFNELQRMTTSADMAVRLRRVFGDIDVRDQASRVSAPTLVLHARNDAMVRFERGRKVAAGIPGARFVPLESQNHLLLEDEPAWPVFLGEVERFMAET